MDRRRYRRRYRYVWQGLSYEYNFTQIEWLVVFERVVEYAGNRLR